MRLAETPVVVPLTNPGHVRRLSVNPSGTELLVGQRAHGKHRALSRWQLPDLTPLPGPDPCPLTPDHGVCNVLGHADDTVVVVAGLVKQQLNVVDLATGTSSSPVDDEVEWAVAASNLLAVTGARTQIINWSTRDVVWRPDSPAQNDNTDDDSLLPSDDVPLVPIIALHPDGRSFAIGGWGEPVVKRYSLDTGEIITTLSDAPPEIQWLGFGPGGHHLVATASHSGAVSVWRAGETAPHRPEVFGAMDYNVAVFHPDGEHCAMGMGSGYLGIHRLSDGERVDGKRAHKSGLNALGFTPDGERLFTGGDDGKLLTWEVLR